MLGSEHRDREDGSEFKKKKKKKKKKKRRRETGMIVMAEPSDSEGLSGKRVLYLEATRMGAERVESGEGSC